MSLVNLPHELLDIIIQYSDPKSFENLAVTCKRIYTRCTSFIKRHNELRSRFRSFLYYTHMRDNLVAASDLIQLIATEPIVARHIRIANLSQDSLFVKRASGYTSRKALPSIEDGGAVLQLFAHSKYLCSAGLDWKEYYSTFAEDVRMKRYSQHGSAFLLTLLSDIEDLTMPSSWQPNAATNQLLDVLAKEAKQSTVLSSGLRSVTSFHGSSVGTAPEGWGLSWAAPFLRLPHLRSFESSRNFVTAGIPRSLAFGDSPYIAEALEAAHLCGCCIDDAGITDFLKHTPRLKTLTYSHKAQDDYPNKGWDICKFINAIAREAGGHLNELSVKILVLPGSVLPGKASISGFQKLEKFEFPLELVICNINAAGVTGGIVTSLQRFFNGSQDAFVSHLIPSSVTHLSLLKFEEWGRHDKALDALFYHFPAVRRSRLPNLQEVHIDCKQNDDKVYKEICNRIVTTAREKGVTVRLQAYDFNPRLNWDR